MSSATKVYSEPLTLDDVEMAIRAQKTINSQDMITSSWNCRKRLEKRTQNNFSN